MKKNNFHALLASVMLAVTAGLMTSCANSDNNSDMPVLKCIISSYNEFGAAMLDVTEADMTKAGFTPGDILSITVDDKAIVMPYYDGFYTRNGEYLCVAYPTYPSICFTANNTGLPEELQGLEGHAVIIRMEEKGGCMEVQQALSLKYTNDRLHYPDLNDAQFANARPVMAGNMASGSLYRSSSPFCNDINRASYVAAYLESEKVKTVLNLADTEEKMLSYDMPTYSRSHQPPYVVHCMEGKDRTGYVCALLEGLCGATYEEIVADYLVTYYNYYLVTPAKDPNLCNALVSLRLNPCLMYYAGVSDESLLAGVDFAKAFADYLLSHGMSRQQLDALIQALRSSLITHHSSLLSFWFAKIRKFDKL